MCQTAKATPRVSRIISKQTASLRESAAEAVIDGYNKDTLLIRDTLVIQSTIQYCTLSP